MLNFYSNSGKVKLHTYTINGNEVEVKNALGEHVVKCLRSPDGGQWTDVEKNAWGQKTVSEYNYIIANAIYDNAISELNRAYQEANVSVVTLSDGSVFGPSKSMGGNPTTSLKNTIDLIRDGVEFAVYSNAETITLSDSNNVDVTYTIDYNSPKPDYILPIVEIAERLAIFFEVKRVLRNNLNDAKATSFADLDLMSSIDTYNLFKANVAAILEAKYPTADPMDGPLEPEAGDVEVPEDAN